MRVFQFTIVNQQLYRSIEVVSCWQNQQQFDIYSALNVFIYILQNSNIVRLTI